MQIRVSVASLLQEFHPCTTDYITKQCKGRCCQGTGKIMVTVHESERARIEELGQPNIKIEGGFIQPDERGLCPFKTDDGFCRIHHSKPFGCAASPFTLSKNNVLIVRNRYRLLRCYKCSGSLPAFEAHRFSLNAIFGEAEAQRICDEIISGRAKMATFLTAEISEQNFTMLKDNDAAKKQSC